MLFTQAIMKYKILQLSAVEILNIEEKSLKVFIVKQFKIFVSARL